MSISGSDSVMALGTTQIIVPLGITVAVQLLPMPKQNRLTMKYFSGGTLFLITCDEGASMTAAQLNGTSGYIFGTTEVMTFTGTPWCYLGATGATCVVQVAIGKSPGQ